MTERAIITLGSNRGEETPPIPPLARGGEAGSNTRCSAKHKNPPPISTSPSISDHCNYILEFLGRIYMRNSYCFEQEHLFQGAQKSNGYTWLNRNRFSGYQSIPISVSSLPTYINTGFLFCCLATDQVLIINEGHGTAFRARNKNCQRASSPYDAVSYLSVSVIGDHSRYFNRRQRLC